MISQTEAIITSQPQGTKPNHLYIYDVPTTKNYSLIVHKKMQICQATVKPLTTNSQSVNPL